MPSGAAHAADGRGATAAPAVLPVGVVGTAPWAAAVAAALAGSAGRRRLGGRTLGQVVDVGSGSGLQHAGETTGAAPASTEKIVTAAAVLSVYGPQDRVTTTVIAGPTPGAVDPGRGG